MGGYAILKCACGDTGCWCEWHPPEVLLVKECLCATLRADSKVWSGIRYLSRLCILESEKASQPVLTHNYWSQDAVNGRTLLTMCSGILTFPQTSSREWSPLLTGMEGAFLGSGWAKHEEH